MKFCGFKILLELRRIFVKDFLDHLLEFDLIVLESLYSGLSWGGKGMVID